MQLLKRQNPIAFLFIWCALFMTFSYSSPARDLHVPGDYATVSEALRASDSSADRIILAGNHVIKNSIILNKPVKIFSMPAGAQVEVPTSVGLVIGHGATSVSLDGITFRNSHEGILIDADCQLNLNNCRFLNNQEEGILIGSHEPLAANAPYTVAQSLTNCQFEGNVIGVGNFGKNHWTLSASGNTFLNNSRSGIRIESDGKNLLTIDKCTFKNNQQVALYLSSFSPAILSENCMVSATLTDCPFTDNNRGIVHSGVLEARLHGKRVNIFNNSKSALVFESHPAVTPHFWLEDTTLSQNSNGVLIQGPVDLKLSRCDLSGNSTGLMSARYLHEPMAYRDDQVIKVSNDVSVLADHCQFTRNKVDGISLTRSGSFTFNDCLIFNNTKCGVMASCGKENPAPPESVVHLVLNGCEITSNVWHGISYKGYHNLDLAVNRSRISSNQTGIVFAPEKGYYSLGTAAYSEIIDKDLGVRFDDSLMMYFIDNIFWNKGRYNHFVAFTPRSCLSFTSSTLSPNTAKGINSKYQAKYGYFWDKDWFAKLDPPKIIHALRNNENLLSHPPVKPVKFSDLEKAETNTDWSAALLAIGDSFSEKIGKSRSELSSDALDYLNKNPDSKISCLLFQNLLGDGLRFEEEEHLTKFTEIVEGNPNSAIADAICSELTMRGLHYPEYGKICDAFKARCHVAPDTLSGILLNAIDATTPTLNLRRQPYIEKLIKTFERLDQLFPDAQNKVTRGFNHYADINTDMGMCLLVRRCQLLSNLLGVTSDWQQLGQYERAEKFFILAHRERFLFGPANKDAYNLPYRMYLNYTQAQSSLKKKAMGIREICDNCKGTTLTSQISKRIRAHVKLYADLDALQPFSEVNAEIEFKKLQDSALQLYLNDIRELIQINANPDLMKSYFKTFNEEISKRFENQENIAALNWLDQEAARYTQPPQIEEAYCNAMASLYKKWNEKSKEAEMLTRLASLGAKSQYAQQAFERLTDLYLTFWKLPDKAIQTQQAMARAFAGTENEYKAEMRVAKIYYENKKFSEAIFELTRLIGKLPANYAKEPAQTMLGLAYLGTQSYDDARNEFAKVINTDQGEYREKCLYLTGYSFICEQKYQEAVKPFTDLIQLYPKSSYASQADSFLKKINSSRQ